MNLAHTFGSLVGVRDSIAIAKLGKGKWMRMGRVQGKRTEVDAKLSERASNLAIGLLNLL